MSDADPGHGVALARSALAGNPSDGYGGAVLAFTFAERRARACAVRSSAPAVDPESELVRASVNRFARMLAPEAISSAVDWSTDIPRAVGLGGSSAIVIATLRALCDCYGVSLTPVELAEFALAVETEDLGITAGLQDRVAQAYGGLTFMEFSDPPHYERLEPSLLPPLLIAWRAETAEHSGSVHGGLRVRFDRGERVVVQAMATLASSARNARAALLAGDRERLADSVSASFDARRRMMTLDHRHVEMIEIARAGGAGANYTGSGGSIVAVCRDDDHRDALTEGLARIGCHVLAVDDAPAW